MAKKINDLKDEGFIFNDSSGVLVFNEKNIELIMIKIKDIIPNFDLIEIKNINIVKSFKIKSIVGNVGIKDILDV